MHPILHRTLKAYRPLYLHGLLRDGHYLLPSTATSKEVPASSSRSRRHMLLAALSGLQHSIFHHRSKP